jgi:hypothetical protein
MEELARCRANNLDVVGTRLYHRQHSGNAGSVIGRPVFFRAGGDDAYMPRMQRLTWSGHCFAFPDPGSRAEKDLGEASTVRQSANKASLLHVDAGGGRQMHHGNDPAWRARP